MYFSITIILHFVIFTLNSKYSINTQILCNCTTRLLMKWKEGATRASNIHLTSIPLPFEGTRSRSHRRSPRISARHPPSPRKLEKAAYSPRATNGSARRPSPPRRNVSTLSPAARRTTIKRPYDAPSSRSEASSSRRPAQLSSSPRSSGSI